MTAKDTIPVSVLTGFLGAGKTSLLNTLLKDPSLADAAVIINEFGEIGLDHLLVETADSNVFEMSSGCLCCTIRGDLADTMMDLVARRDSGTLKAFDRIIIETTGLAEPAPILQTLIGQPDLVQRFRLQEVVTVVDAKNGASTLDNHIEAVNQVAVADRLVLSKADLLNGPDGEAALDDIISRMRKLAPSARILTTHNGEATAGKLFEKVKAGGVDRAASINRWLAADAFDAPHRVNSRNARRARSEAKHEMAHHESEGHQNNHGHHHEHDVNRHDDHIKSFSIATDRSIGKMQFELFLELLQSYHGPNLLRMKGIVKLDDDPLRPVVVHGVQHVLHPPERLDRWPDEDHRTRLVFITRDIKREELDKLLHAFTDPITGGAEAFADDTLSLRRDIT